MTIFGTRPEIIRLSLTIPLFDRFADRHVLIHTGQNYTPELSDNFFSELGIRSPDVRLGVHSNDFAEQASAIIERIDRLLEEIKPDRVVILGDTNSGLSAIAAARRRIPVYHIEAGNRCFDDRVPEELNRRLIDQCSSVLLPYTQRSKENLIREGFERERIFVIGNPIFEVLSENAAKIASSDVLVRLGLTARSYVLVTAHRAENVDHPERLSSLLNGLTHLATESGLRLVWPVHPRTAARLSNAALPPRDDALLIVPPQGFFDFVRLEGQAACVVTDSGTVQEECAILRVPNVTVRDVTERPETVEAGSNIVAGIEPDALVRSVRLARALPTDWHVPVEYLIPHVSTAIAKVVLGTTSLRQHFG